MAENQGLALNTAYTQYVSRLKDGQLKKVSQDLNRFVQWYGASGSLDSLTPQDAASYCEWVSQRGGDVAKKLEPVKAFLSYLKKEKLVTHSLASHIRAPKNKSRAKAQRTQAEAAAAAELTKEGHLKLTAELDNLKAERIRVVDDIGRAMADKDFRENAPLDAAKERQGFVESRIRELEHTLNSAVVAAKSSAKKDRVTIGKRVILTDIGRKSSHEYVVVHPREANPREGKISSESPVGKALLNEPAGKVVNVNLPKGAIKYLIKDVRE